MGLFRVLAYPVVKTYQMDVQSRRLAFVYDIANRLVKSLGLPNSIDEQRSYIVIGNNLARELQLRGLTIKGATITGQTESILEAINYAIPIGIRPETGLSMQKLEELRIILPQHFRLGNWFTRHLYDNFVPIKSIRALDHIIQVENKMLALGKKDLVQLGDQIEQVKKDISSLSGQMSEQLGELKHLRLSQQAANEITDAIYKSGSGKSTMENIQEMFDVITNWARQIVGRSEGTEAAGWININKDGKFGSVPRFVIYQEGLDILKAETIPLKRKNGESNNSFTIPEDQTTATLSGARGDFITIEEWDRLSMREDLLILENDEGNRQLYRRIFQPGEKLAGMIIEGMTKEKFGQTISKMFGAAVRTFASFMGMIKNFKNAYVDLEPIAVADAGLKQGEVIPYIQEGTTIKLISTSSTKPNRRDEKIRIGEALEEAAAKADKKIGIVNQSPERSIGNVRTSGLIPLCYMIKDVKNFAVRRQNEFLLSIVDVHSYFISTLWKFNEQGEVVCLGALEVTNPEIIPGKMSEKEIKQLKAQFEAGKLFAKLASTGIMVKVLQDELNDLTRQYLGKKIHQLVKERRFDLLRGVKIDDATVMFADISGFTALSDKLKEMPDKVVQMLSNLFSRLDPIIVKNGGIVDKHDGDAIMADFGAPLREKGDIEAAVTSAIQLQIELQKINNDLFMQNFYRDYKLKPLGITIGVNTGTVIAGNLGHEGSKIEYSLIGDSVNGAARLQHAILRGQILIGEKTYTQLSPEFKRNLLHDFNHYNRDIVGIKKFILDEHRLAGMEISEEELDKKLQLYLKLYQPAGEEDIFVPFVIFAKNKGVIPCYFLRWDRHAWRHKFLEKAGITFPNKPKFENQPPSVEETMRSLEDESFEEELAKMRAERKQARIGFQEFLARQKKADTTKTSTPVR
jgi:class 3 adenylate cyclase